MTSGKIAIRDAAQTDLEAITELILRCSRQFILPELSTEGVREYLSSHSLEKMNERLEQFQYQVLLEGPEKIIGVAGMKGHSHLYHLHVDPAYHRHGYGRLLWKSIQSEAIRSGHRTFTVNSSRYAVPFYEKLGFVCLGEETKTGVIYFPMKMSLST